MTRNDEGCESSDFFAVVDIPGSETVGSASDGDLWPSAWADDDWLYTACGDGLGFDLEAPWSDIVINRIAGMPETGLTGERLACGDDVAPVWTDPTRFNRKPTGMVAVDGDGDGRDELYLAVQDLGFPGAPGGADPFDEAPAAGVVRSSDRGRTWVAPSTPMFVDHVFTTIVFLDLGKSHRYMSRVEPWETEHFVYAVGLDGNWRTSHSRRVPDPQDLYLARVPARAVQERDAWQFFSGNAPGGRPLWSFDIAERRAVLTDRSRRYAGADRERAGSRGHTPIAQGGVTYIPGLDRFVYVSWSEYTFEVYEAPEAWGPWRHAAMKDFGPLLWSGPLGPLPRHGGYAPTLPSKFVSDDGREAWLQSNWFGGASTFAGRTYHYSLRKIRLDPATDVPAPPPPPGVALSSAAYGAWPISTAARVQRLDVLNDGRTDRAEDSWNGTAKQEDHWGYVWAQPVRANQVVYVSGPYDPNGGWFEEPPRVQVRTAGRWVDAASQAISPSYVPGPEATGTRRYTIDFPDVTVDGVRLVGPPGGAEHYSAISELEVNRVERR